MMCKLYHTLSVVDSLFALIVVFPLTCMYFRGIWDLIGYYVLPGSTPFQYWVHVLIAQLQVPTLLLLPYIDRLDRSRKLRFWLITRLFMFVFTIPFMFYWHGLWLIIDHYFGTDWEYSAGVLAVTYSILCILGASRSCVWPPFITSMDTQVDSLSMVTRFKAKFERGGYRDYVADVYLSQLIILGMAIVSWRSIFNIYQHFIGADLEADIFCAKVGTIGSAALLFLQVLFASVSAKLSNYSLLLKILWEDVMYLVTFVMLSLLWRGVWNLNVRFVLTMPEAGWMNFIVGSAGMLALQIFTGVSNFGIAEDGVDKGGEAFYPVHYFTVIFKRQCEAQKDEDIQQTKVAEPTDIQNEMKSKESVNGTSIYTTVL